MSEWLPPVGDDDRWARLRDGYPEPELVLALFGRRHVLDIGSTTEAKRIALRLGCRLFGYDREEITEPVPAAANSPPCPIVFPPDGMWVRETGREGGIEFWEGARERIGWIYARHETDRDALRLDLERMGLEYCPAHVKTMSM